MISLFKRICALVIILSIASCTLVSRPPATATGSLSKPTETPNRVATAMARIPTVTPQPPSPTSILPTPTRAPITPVMFVALPTPTPIVTPNPLTPKPTFPPVSSVTLYVGNTGGGGAYLRATPKMEDTLTNYPDGTAMATFGDPITLDSIVWFAVRAPDGANGWMPLTYLVPTKPATVVFTATPKPAPTATPTPVATPVRFTRDQFVALVRAKYSDEVIAAVGTPDATDNIGGGTAWYYYRRTYDPASGVTDSVAQVVFGGRSPKLLATGINFSS